jgi:hypothetical protein
MGKAVGRKPDEATFNNSDPKDKPPPGRHLRQSREARIFFRFGKGKLEKPKSRKFFVYTDQKVNKYADNLTNGRHFYNAENNVCNVVSQDGSVMTLNSTADMDSFDNFDFN